jgi:hypothetical protein
MSGRKSVVYRCQQPMDGPTNHGIRDVNSQAAAPIQLRLNRNRGHPFVTETHDTDVATRTRPEVQSSREDSPQQTSTPSNFESSQDFVTSRRSAFNNDSGNDNRGNFRFPDPLSPVTEGGTPSVGARTEPTKSSCSETTVVEAKLAAEHCGSLQERKSHKGKGVARDPSPTLKSQEPSFVPLLEEYRQFPKQPEHEKQTQKPRSSSFTANSRTSTDGSLHPPQHVKLPNDSHDREKSSEIRRL